MTPPDEEFDPFYRAIYPELRKYGMAWGRNWQDADDAARDVMIDIRRRWFTVDPGRRAAYARVALVRAILKIRRERHAHNTSPVPVTELPLPPRDDLDLGAYEGRQWVDQLLSCLPCAQRAVMEAFLAGITFKEFAAELQRREAATTGRPMSAEEEATDLDRRAATARKNFQHARSALRPLVAEYERPRPAGGATTGRGETR
ncbi:RNA polymerase sigma factor [Actinoplanes sp. CA-131856]